MMARAVDLLKATAFLLLLICPSSGSAQVFLSVAGQAQQPRKPPPELLSPGATFPDTVLHDPAMLRDLQQVSAETGWVLMGDKVFWTNDNGSSWADITPNDPVLSRIDKVFFLDNSHGWALKESVAQTANSESVSLVLAITFNQGRKWTEIAFRGLTPINLESYGKNAELFFVSPTQGWAEFDQMSSSNFSFGLLFSTTDGGKTWLRQPAPPIFGALRFTSSTNGWLAGGAGLDELYKTTDGGTTWSLQDLPRTPGTGVGTYRRTIMTPSFTDLQNGLTAVFYHKTNASTVTLILYRTEDAGKTWRPIHNEEANLRTSFAICYSRSSTPAWVSVSQSDRTLNLWLKPLGRDDEETTQTSSLPAAVPWYAGIRSVSMIGDNTWVYVTGSRCTNHKNCLEYTGLLTSKDRGKTWSAVSLPKGATGVPESFLIAPTARPVDKPAGRLPQSRPCGFPSITAGTVRPQTC